MSEERLRKLETKTESHSQEIRGIYVALNEITETMKAFAVGITELREGLAESREEMAQSREEMAQLRQSQQNVIETQRSVLSSVERLNNTVEILARQADEDRRAWQAEIRQIWEYLLNQRNNGHEQ